MHGEKEPLFLSRRHCYCLQLVEELIDRLAATSRLKVKPGTAELVSATGFACGGLLDRFFHLSVTAQLC